MRTPRIRIIRTLRASRRHSPWRGQQRAALLHHTMFLKCAPHSEGATVVSCTTYSAQLSVFLFFGSLAPPKHSLGLTPHSRVVGANAGACTRARRASALGGHKLTIHRHDPCRRKKNPPRSSPPSVAAVGPRHLSPRPRVLPPCRVAYSRTGGRRIHSWAAVERRVLRRSRPRLWCATTCPHVRTQTVG